MLRLDLRAWRCKGRRRVYGVIWGEENVAKALAQKPNNTHLVQVGHSLGEHMHWHLVAVGVLVLGSLLAHALHH